MGNWNERWEQNLIGWHNHEVNQNLQNHHSILLEANDSPRILVPLCGKSLDIGWLATKASEVVGVELVQKAIDDFFLENNHTPTAGPFQNLLCYSLNNITLICSDILKISPEHIGYFDAIYDRAALVALSPELRQAYVNICLRLLKPEGQILLLTYDSHIPETQGPPFPIKDGVIPTLYQTASECILLEELVDTSKDDHRLQKRGLDWSKTCIWKITK